MADAKDYLEEWRDRYSFPNYITDNPHLTDDGSLMLDNDKEWSFAQLMLLKGNAIGTASNFYLDPNPLYNKLGEIYASIVQSAFLSARTDAIKMNVRNMDYTNGKNLSIASIDPYDFFKFLIGIPDDQIYTNERNPLVITDILALPIIDVYSKEEHPFTILVTESDINSYKYYKYGDTAPSVSIKDYLIYFSNWYTNDSYKQAFYSLFNSDNRITVDEYWNRHWNQVIVENSSDKYYFPNVSYATKFGSFRKKLLTEGVAGLQLLMPQYHRRVEVEDLNKNFWVISQILDAVVNALWGPYGLIDVVRQLILKVEQIEGFLGLDSINDIELLHGGSNDLYFDMYSRFTMPDLQLKLITDSGERIIKNIFKGHSKNVDRRTINGETTTNGSSSVPELFEEITEEMYNTSYFNNTSEGTVELWGANNKNFTGLFDSDLARSIEAFNVSNENAGEEYQGWTGNTYASLSSVIDAINNKIVGDEKSFTGYTYSKRQRDKDFFEILDPNIGDGRLTTKEYSVLEQDIKTDFSEVVLTPDQVKRFKKYNKSYNYLKEFDTTPEEISPDDKDIIAGYYIENGKTKYCPTNFEGKDLKDLYSEVYSIVPFMDGVDDYKEFLNGQLDDIYNHLEVTYNAHKINDNDDDDENDIAEIKINNNDGRSIFEIYETLNSQYDNIRRMGKLEDLDNPKFYTVLYIPEQHLYDKDVLTTEGILKKDNFEEDTPTSDKLINTIVETNYAPFKTAEAAINYHTTVSAAGPAEFDDITVQQDNIGNFIVSKDNYTSVMEQFSSTFSIPLETVEEYSPSFDTLFGTSANNLREKVLLAILEKSEDKNFNKSIQDQLKSIGLNSENFKEVEITMGGVTVKKTFYTNMRYSAFASGAMKSSVNGGPIEGDIAEQLSSLFNQGINKNTNTQQTYNGDLNTFLENFKTAFNSISINIPNKDAILTLKTPERIFIINEESVSNTMRNNIEKIIIDDITKGLGLNDEEKKDLVDKCVLPAIYDLPFKIHHLDSLQMIENDRIPLYGATIASLLASDLAKEDNKQINQTYTFTNSSDNDFDNPIDFFFNIAESEKNIIDVRDCAAMVRFAKTGGNYEYWERMIEIEKYIDNDDNWNPDNPPIQRVKKEGGVERITLLQFFRDFGVPESVEDRTELKNYLFIYIDNPQKNLTTLAKYYIPTNKFLNLLQEIDDSQKEGVDWSSGYQKQALLNSVKEQEYGIYDNILIYLFDQDYYSLRADYTGSNNKDFHFPSLYVRNTDLFFSDVSNPLIPGRVFLEQDVDNSYTIPLFVPRKDLIGGEIIEMRLSGNYNNRKRLDFNAAVDYMLRREGQDAPKLIDGSRLTFKLYNSFADNLGQYNYRTTLFFKDTSEAFKHPEDFKITSINDIFTQGVQATYFKPSLYKELNKQTAVTKAQLFAKNLKLCASMIASSGEYIDNSYELTVGLNDSLPMSDPDENNYADSIGPKPKSCYLFERKQAYCSAVRNNLVFYSSPSTNEYGQFIHSPLLALTSPNKFTPSTTIQTAEINSKGITSLANKNDKIKRIPYDVMGKVGDKCTLIGIKDMLYRNAYEQIPPTIEMCWGRRDVNDYIKTKKLKYIVIEREKGDRHKYYAPTCAGISVSEGFLHDYNQKGLTSVFESAHYNHPIVWYDENGKPLGYYGDLGSQYTQTTSYPCPSKAVYGVIDLSQSGIDISKGSTFLVRFYNSNPAVFEKDKNKCEPWTREEFTYYNPNSEGDKTLITRRPIINRVYFLGESDSGTQRSLQKETS